LARRIATASPVAIRLLTKTLRSKYGSRAPAAARFVPAQETPT